MTGPRNGNSDLPSSASAPEQSERTTKRAWRTPQLRHLGSIRELTLGATMGKTEGNGTFKAPGQM